MSQVVILESVMPFDYSLDEAKEGGKLKIKGVYQRADTLNENGRIYPRRILEREVQSLQDVIRDRRLLGELNHPASADINLERACHIITKLEMKNDGVVFGESEVLTGTPYGAILESLIKNNVKLGISSRGKGSTVYRNGVNEVSDDYRMITFDIVSRPSTPGAYPQAIVESFGHSGKIISVSRLIEAVLNGDMSEKDMIDVVSGRGSGKYFSFKK